MPNWPSLPLEEWRDTRDTLHMWTQIVGKIRLASTPRINHWWNVALYVSAHGLTTSTIPYGESWFDLEFDFIAHVLRVRTCDTGERQIALAPRSVADFYRETMSVLASLGIDVKIWPVPSEVSNPIRFDVDETHHTYDAAAAERFWRVLALTDRVFTKFRSGFVGKCSPVHFFWGSFDLAVTRFSGRRAPANPAADAVTAEAYSHEASSVGWWPGDERLAAPHFYSYAAPEPPGLAQAIVRPAEAFYDAAMGGFYLPHDAVARAADPEQTLLDFCDTTYAAAADAGNWDRANLERV